MTGVPSGTGAITVNSGAAFSTDTIVPAVSVSASGTFASGYTFSNLAQTGTAQPASLTTASGGILAFKLSNSTNNGNDQIVVAGNLSLANSTVINISSLLNNALAFGSYPLILAPSNSTSVGSLLLTGLPISRQTYSTSSSLTEVDLNVSTGSAASLVWAGSSSNNFWDLTVTKNWLNTGAGNVRDFFYNLDNVTFNDSGSTSGAVTLNGVLQPGSVALTMTNAASAYSFSGTGSITGNTGLVMNGVGSLTINNSSSYTGETDIHGGNLIINSGGLLGDISGLSATYIGGPSASDSATVAVHSGGTLSGSSITLGSAAGSTGAGTQNGGLINAPNGTLMIGDSGAGTYTLSGGTISASALSLGGSIGTGSMTQNGGVVNLANASQLSVGIGGSGSYTIGGSAALNMAGSGGFFRVGGFDPNGIGSFTQGGSSVVTLGSSGSGLNFASVAAGGTGTYTLNSGTLTVYTSGNQFNVGDRAGGPGLMTINGGAATIYGGFNVGKNGGSQGTLTQTAGALSMPDGNLAIALNGSSSGVYNLQNGTISAGDLRVDGGTGTVNQSGGTVNLRFWLRMGINNGSVGTYSLTNGTINANRMNIGEAGIGSMVIPDGQVTLAGPIDVGGTDFFTNNTTGSGSLSITGSSSVMITTNNSPSLNLGVNGGTANVLLGDNASLINTSTSGNPQFAIGNGGVATLTQSGNTTLTTAGGELWVGQGIGGVGTFNLSGGTVNVGFWTDFGRGGGSAVVNMSGGVINKTGGGNFNVADDAGVASLTTGTLNQSGGTITDNNEMWVGQDTNGNGVYNMAGGQLNVGSWLAVGRSGGIGVVTMTGGTINKVGSGTNIIVGSLGGNGTWNMNAGLVTNTTGLVIGENSNVGNFYLNGGTVQADGVATYGGATGNLYFNGGVLQATAGTSNGTSNGNFLANTNDYIQAAPRVSIPTDLRSALPIRSCPIPRCSARTAA